jgi:hypothetical protein
MSNPSAPRLPDDADSFEEPEFEDEEDEDEDDDDFPLEKEDAGIEELVPA